MLVIQTNSQREISFFGYNVHKLVSPILVIHDLSIYDAAVWREHLVDGTKRRDVSGEPSEELLPSDRDTHLSRQNGVAVLAGPPRFISRHHGH